MRPICPCRHGVEHPFQKQPRAWLRFARGWRLRALEFLLYAMAKYILCDICSWYALSVSRSTVDNSVKA